MDFPPKYNPYLDPTNKQHRHYTRLDTCQSPDHVPDTPFNSPTAMSLSNPTSSSADSNPFSINQLIMDGNQSSPSSSTSSHPLRKPTPTSAPSDWQSASGDCAESSGLEGPEQSDITSASRECHCGSEGIQTKQSDEGPSSGIGNYMASCGEQSILGEEDVERGRCRTRTNSSSSRDKTSCSRENRRRLDL
ncbi:hypothetical protein NHQ30_003329 [Ciborinia camelliae]|nr:hypothetical protein NHQ30_003329 [Ciborinia camelliae]